MAKKPYDRKNLEKLFPTPTDSIDEGKILRAAKILLASEEKAAIRRQSDPGTAAHMLIKPRRELKEAIGQLPPGGWLADSDAVSRVPIALRQLAEVAADPDNLASIRKLRAAIANLMDTEIDERANNPATRMPIEQPADQSAYIPAKDCRGEGIETHDQLLAAIRKHGLRTNHKGQRLLVHAGDWHRLQAERRAPVEKLMDDPSVADRLAEEIESRTAKIRAKKSRKSRAE